MCQAAPVLQAYDSRTLSLAVVRGAVPQLSRPDGKWPILAAFVLFALAGCEWATRSGGARDPEGGIDGAAPSEGGVSHALADASADSATAGDGEAGRDAAVRRVKADAGADPVRHADTRDDAAVGGERADSEQEDAGPGADLGCPLPDGVVEDGAVDAPEQLLLEVPSEPPVGVPFPLSVSTRSGAPLSATVRVCANDVSIAVLQMYRGRGSVSLNIPQPGVLPLQARASRAYGSRKVTAVTRPPRRYEGSLGPGVHTWTPTQDVVIHGTLRVGTAETLTIAPGTRVLLGTNASLAIAGELRVEGTAEHPVLFTRIGARAWGGIRLSSGARATLEHAWFVAGGGDSSRTFGHSNSQPVVFVDSASLGMRGGGVIDNPGKAFGSNRATISLDGVLISRSDTGGQFDVSQLRFRHLHVLEIPDADGRLDDDDNDGFYVGNASGDDSVLEAVIEDSVFARGEDDAIDQNGAKLRIERVWVEGFSHEGVACSTGREVNIRDSVVRDCGQGIEAGYGSPRVRVERTLLTGNGVGVRYGDEYSWDTNGSLEVDHSIVAGNRENVRNFVSKLNGPLPGALRIVCSVVDDAQVAATASNVLPPASQPWPTSSCIDSPLLDPLQCETAHAGPPCP
jgi:hypothetical protein